MVLIDKSKGSQGLKAGGSDSPAYGISGVPFPVYGSSQPIYTVPVQGDYYDASGHRRSPWMRFLKAASIALLVWIMCGALIRSLFWVVDWDIKHRGEGWGMYPVPPEVSLEDCVEPEDWETTFSPRSSFTPPYESLWEGAFGSNDASMIALPYPYYPHASTTSFELPLTSESLYLLSRGPFASGSVDIMTASEQNSDSVGVHVTLRYYRKEVRDATRVCAISRGKGDSGVGIFTPRYLGRGNPGRSLYIETTIILPELDEELWPLQIKNLETDVQNTLHRVHAIGDQVRFAKLNLKGSNAAISANSLVVTSAVVQTSNGQISGSFNATKDLTIETSNGRITIQANLNNNASGPPTSLRLRTSNSVLRANVDLFTTSGKKNLVSEKHSPQYDVEAKTSNSRLEVTFGETPADATLRFDGITSNGYATSLLPPAYQGSFSIQTSNSLAELNVRNPDVPDPSGKGRERKVEQKYVSRTGLAGSVAWVGGSGEKRQVPKGTASLKTSNGRVVLVI